MASIPANVALNGKGLGGGMADDHQALDLLVTPNSRVEGKLADASLGEVHDSHFGLLRAPG